LTELGISQASRAHDAWKEELTFRMPLPDKMYCSPLTRAIRTHEITFRGIVPESERSTRKAVVVEVGARCLLDPNMILVSSLSALSRV
jgi:broad specificity phosphatase PhoE